MKTKLKKMISHILFLATVIFSQTSIAIDGDLLEEYRSHVQKLIPQAIGGNTADLVVFWEEHKGWSPETLLAGRKLDQGQFEIVGELPIAIPEELLKQIKRKNTALKKALENQNTEQIELLKNELQELNLKLNNELQKVSVELALFFAKAAEKAAIQASGADIAEAIAAGKRPPQRKIIAWNQEREHLASNLGSTWYVVHILYPNQQLDVYRDFIMRKELIDEQAELMKFVAKKKNELQNLMKDIKAAEIRLDEIAKILE